MAAIAARIKKLEQANASYEIHIIEHDDACWKNFHTTIARIKGAGRLPESHTKDVEMLCQILNNPMPNRQISDFL